ncbi:MAG: DNA polymerase Y family protein [Akkermansiaceae bacterium]|nr:DNA polymerase Y family protein [Akkermansiaceae bacterium]
MFASLHIPDFPAAALLRTTPVERPCAVIERRPGHEIEEKLPLLALNEAARGTGIAAGWALNRALVRCPDLLVLPRDPAAEAALAAELVRLGDSLGPDLELTAPDSLIIDLSTRPDDPGPLLRAQRLPRCRLWHAWAETPDLAHLAARHPLTHGREANPDSLQPLPLALLDSLAPGHPALDLLRLWGLSTLGDFMKLPRQALAERLGPDAGRWHDLLHARHRRLLHLFRPPESFVQDFDFEEFVVSLETIVFVLRRLIHTLSTRLAARHLAARELDLQLRLESGNTLRRSLRLPEPQCSPEAILPPLQTALEALRPDAPITGIRLDARTTFGTAAQREWFGRQLPQPERWTETLAQLDALLGVGQVGIGRLKNSFQSSDFGVLSCSELSEIKPTASFFPENSVPLFRYRPPRIIAVAHELRGKRPWPLAILNGPFAGRILDCRGPFSASGSWWDPELSWQQLEWDIQLENGRLMRLSQHPGDRWQLEGSYG